jgi:hypothetical protein
MSGAAAWVSADSAKFRIVERAPVLASGAAGETWSFDAVAADGGWVMVGGEQPKGRIDRDAVGWLSADGVQWQRLPANGATPAYEELQRVALDSTPLAVGLRGGAFGVWRLAGEKWQPGASFGVAAPGGKGSVRSLAVAGTSLFCVTSDGVSHTLWESTDGGARWHPVALPAPAPAGADRTVAVSGAAGQVLLLHDDGGQGRIYVSATTG